MKSLIVTNSIFILMQGKAFFLKRYMQLGWEYYKPKLKPAIRLNTTKMKQTVLLERLNSIGLHLEKIPFTPSGYWVKQTPVSPGATAEYLLGLYSLQEAAAQVPVTCFSNLPNKIVLDACAAPGGKTIQLADSMNNTGVLIALDIHNKRLNALTNHLERCNTNNTMVYNLDAQKASTLNLTFDRILLDMPCSGNFVTDPQWFNRRTLKDVKRNAKLQRTILQEATKFLAKNGEIIYSTCSLEPEEDELNINWAINNLDLKAVNINCIGIQGITTIFNQKLDSSVATCRRIWPEKTQGFFICKLKRRSKT